MDRGLMNFGDMPGNPTPPPKKRRKTSGPAVVAAAVIKRTERKERARVDILLLHREGRPGAKAQFSFFFVLTIGIA